MRGDAAVFCRQPAGGPFTVVLCDPPSGEPSAGVVALLAALQRAGGLAPGAAVVVERDRRDAELLAGEAARFLAQERRRSYGVPVLVYLRATTEPFPPWP